MKFTININEEVDDRFLKSFFLVDVYPVYTREDAIKIKDTEVKVIDGVVYTSQPVFTYTKELLIRDSIKLLIYDGPKVYLDELDPELVFTYYEQRRCGEYDEYSYTNEQLKENLKNNKIFFTEEEARAFIKAESDRLLSSNAKSLPSTKEEYDKLLTRNYYKIY